MTQVIRNVRLRGRDEAVDVAIDGERIAAVEPAVDVSAEREYEGAGRLLVPGFVNIHQHLDKCMLGDVMRPNRSQTLQEAIHITWDHKRGYTVDEIAGRASHVVEEAIRHGTTAMRAFADVDTIGGLTPVEGLLELKRRFEGLITLEVVAFPQEGIIRDPGCDRLMEQAMDLGCDIVGGLPWYERLDRHVEEHIDFCFELAQRTGKDIHMLADDTDDPYSRSLEYLAVRTIEEGWQGRVAASHCGALAAYDDNHAARVVGMVRDAGITISSNTQISLVLDGRNDRGLVRRGITRVRELLDAGVRVCFGQETVRSTYIVTLRHPDPLLTAQILAHAAQLKSEADMERLWAMPTTAAAALFGLDGYGMAAGCRASLNVFDAESITDAIATVAPRRWVLRDGRVIAETVVERRLHRE
jgi:cytosine/creatinine deaminase